MNILKKIIEDDKIKNIKKFNIKNEFHELENIFSAYNKDKMDLGTY